MKATKRLVKAVAALVASVILCIGVCLAWFAVNDNVDANGLNSSVAGENITKFNVSAYSLSENGDGYTIGEKVQGNGSVVMEAYGSELDGTRKTTALLLEISYDCKDKTFRIQAECNKKYGFEGQTPNDDDTFVCYLSDAVEIFKNVTVTKNGENIVGGTVSKGGAGETFTEEKTTTDENGAEETLIIKNGLLIADGITKGSGAKYCIIDYSEYNIMRLYALAADSGGGISSTINFSFGTQDEKDIVFYMEETVAV